MTFQSTVAQFMGFGVPGELFLDGPFRGQPGIIDSAGPNTIGFAFSQVAGSPGHFTVGGTGVFGGILGNPKEYALFGTSADGPLAPSLDLPQYSNGAFIDMGEIIVNLTSAGNIGDTVDYVNSTGALVARTPSYTPAAGTAAVASSVLTIAALTAGSPAIGVGAVVPTLHGPATILAVLTGTGGNGTYTVQAGLSDSAATAITTPIVTAPATGNTHIAASALTRYNTTDTSSNGLAVVKITQ